MKLRYAKPNLNQLLFILAVNFVLISCGTYQSASYNDGIYGDQTTTSAKKKVIIIDEE